MNKNYNAALNDHGAITFKSLVKYLKDCQEALEEAGDESAALRFEILVEHLVSDPTSLPLKFKSIHLGL